MSKARAAEQRTMIATAGGLKINYFEAGTGPHLVLIHGMFGDYLDWSPALNLLAEHAHVVAIDLPGFGASDKPDVDYNAQFFTDALRAFFADLGLQSVVLAGNSFGGQVAMLHAQRFPEQVEKLILVNSGGFREIPEAERRMARAILNENSLRQMQPAMVPLIFAKVFLNASDAREQYMAKQAAKLSAADYPAYVRAVVRCIDLSMATCVLDRLPEMHLPALVIAGELDPILPNEQAREAAKRLPNARLEVMPGAGHVPQLEQPEEFSRLVQSFLFKKT